MPAKYWFKFCILSIAFTATVASIILLKQGHMKQFWTSLGFSSQERVLNWCDERARSIYFFQSQAKIYESERKWLWQNRKASTGNYSASSPVLLNYLDVEKWFAKYCHLPIEDPTTTSVAGKPLFEVEFITGERLSFQEVDENHIMLRGQVYRAPILRKAFKELLAFGPKIE